MADPTRLLNEKILLAGELVRIGARGKITVSRNVDATTRDIARAYARAWQVTNGVAREMAAYAAEQIHAQNGLSARDVARLDRVNRALHAIGVQMHDLNKFTGVKVGGASSAAAREALETLGDGIALAAGVDRRFTKPTGAAMQGLILRSIERIESARNRLDARTETALKDGLLRGLVLGENPLLTAKHIFDNTGTAFFGGLHRAQTIATTEILDAHRYGTQVGYNATDLVQGWKWLSTLDSRTCPACWSMHGTFHPTTEILLGHQRCRCTMVPVTRDEGPDGVDIGDAEQIFWHLPREDQLKIMGPGRLEALEAGAPWSSLAHLRPSTDWRPSYGVTSVADLTGLANLHLATTPGDVLSIPGESTASVLDTVFKNGGLTIQSLTGEQPTDGFVVAQQGSSLVMDAREFFGPGGPKALAEWMRLHGDQLDAPNAHMGLWWDKQNGKVVADVVVILKDRDAAIALGRANDQISIFDLAKFEEIQTGGTGGYADPKAQADVATGVSTKVPERSMVIGTRANGERVSGVLSYKPDGTPQIRDIDDRVWTVGDHLIQLPPALSYVRATATGDDTGFPNPTGKLMIRNGRTYVTTSDGFGVEVDPESIHVITAAMSPAEAFKHSADVSKALSSDRDGISVDLRGLDPRVVDEAAPAISSMLNDWKVTGDKGPAFRLDADSSNFKYRPTTYAVTRSFFGDGPSSPSADPYGVISLNGESYFKHYDTMERSYRQDTDEGFHPKGTENSPVKSTIDHEYGHYLSNFLFGPVNSRDGKAARAKAVEALTKLSGFREGTESYRDFISDGLSQYATKNIDETFGEALAEFRANGPGKSVVADTLVKMLADAYRKKYGRLPMQPGIEELYR